MNVLSTALALSALGTLGGLLIASSLLLLSARVRLRIVPSLISYAVGTLLAVALLGLVPTALDQLGSTAVLSTLLAGILLFFALEKLVLWTHCHTPECEVHGRPAAPLVLVGGAVHNFADGALISAAVITSLPLGVSAALAVAAHQIPQEVSDYAILLAAGHSRRRALALNFLTALPTLLGASVVYAAAGPLPGILPHVLAFAAGAFLYVAMADLIPDLHRGSSSAGALRQILLIVAGVATMLILQRH